MAGGVNKVILIGNLGKDPEIRRLNSGDPVVSFRLATTETWRDKQSGEKRDRTEWHNVVIYNENIARVAEQFLKKGSRCYIEGQLQTREWQDQASGQKRFSTEVVLQRYRGELTLLDGKSGGEIEDRGAGASGGDYGNSGGGSYGGGGSRSGGGDYNSGGNRSGGSSAPAGRGNSRNDLDDDIPF